MTPISQIPQFSTFIAQSNSIYRMCDYAVPNHGSYPAVNLVTGETRWFSGDEQVERADYNQGVDLIKVHKKCSQLQSILELAQANAQTWYGKYNALRLAVDNLKSL